MNALSIPKQADNILQYSYHAKEMAKSRDIPRPKYLPLNAKCVDIKIRNGQICYKIDYAYNNIIYTMILGEDGGVLTIYCNMRKNKMSYEEETYLLWLIRLNKKQQKIYEKQQEFNIKSVAKISSKRYISELEYQLLYDISWAQKQKQTFLQRCA